jgi:hypothetical protein
MANSAHTQQALADDPRFQKRVSAALAKIAWEVLGESDATPNHAERAAYARQVINGINGTAAQIAPWLVMRTNLFAFETSYDFAEGAVVTASGDADIESQLASDWSEMAGV